MTQTAHPATQLLTNTRTPRRRMAALEALIDGAAMLGAMHPGADPSVYGVEVVRDVAYRDSGSSDHHLDIYRPAGRQGPLPVVLYVHGGGFRLLSKDTHWMMGVSFARHGYLVLNINYRLAKHHPFPAALEDVSSAWLWALEHLEELGGDPNQIVVAGESAGANLVTSLTLQTTYRRDELWARRVFEAGVVPSAVVGLCGIYEVGNIGRLVENRGYPSLVRDWVLGIESSYLDGWARDAVETELADPLRLLERGEQPVRPLPPFFLSVGTADPLVEDSERLVDALGMLGVANVLHRFEGEVHAFQMLTWRRAAKASWRRTFDFLTAHGVPPARRTPTRGNEGLRQRLSQWTRDRVLDVMAA